MSHVGTVRPSFLLVPLLPVFPKAGGDSGSRGDTHSPCLKHDNGSVVLTGTEHPESGHRASEGRWTEPHSLGIGFLQQRAPELVVVGGVEEDQAVPERGQTVIDHDVQPFTVLPELAPGARPGDRVSHAEVCACGKCLPLTKLLQGKPHPVPQQGHLSVTAGPPGACPLGHILGLHPP